MTMLAQQFAVGAAVVVALGYLLRRLWRRLRSEGRTQAAGARRCGDCSGCGNCPAARR